MPGWLARLTRFNKKTGLTSVPSLVARDTPFTVPACGSIPEFQLIAKCLVLSDNGPVDNAKGEGSDSDN
eukprot:6207523-Alexandrium_andersonii.AAC.1